MKILLISSSNNVENGGGNLTHEYCRYLKSRGIDFILLLPKKEPRYDYVDYPVDYVLPEYIFNTRTKKVIDYLRFSYPTDADIVHSILEFPYGLIGAKLARKYKKPFIVGTQGTYAIRPLLQQPDRYFTAWMYRTARVITAPSAFTADSIKKFINLKTPIKIIHNGVNFKRFDVSANTKPILERYGNKKLLLTVGGLKPRKGQDIVLEALAILKKDRDDFHYLIVGPDEKRSAYFGELQRIIKEHNLEKQVTFVGAVLGSELINYFHAAFIYVHTPRLVNWNFEGFGIVYLEASACKKPIVAADSGGIRDAVVDGETGLVVPENDPTMTAKAIAKLLDDPSLADRLGQAGYEYAKKHDWPKIGDQYLELYKSLLS